MFKQQIMPSKNRYGWLKEGNLPLFYFFIISIASTYFLMEEVGVGFEPFGLP